MFFSFKLKTAKGVEHFIVSTDHRYKAWELARQEARTRYPKYKPTNLVLDGTSENAEELLPQTETKPLRKPRKKRTMLDGGDEMKQHTPPSTIDELVYQLLLCPGPRERLKNAARELIRDFISRKLQTKIDEAKFSIEFQQKWEKDHPAERNAIKMHFKDGRLEAFEEMLREFSAG